FSSYVLQLRVPHVSLTVENIADFLSAYILGNLLQMGFRFWAFRRWVFPDEFARSDQTPGSGAETNVVSLFRRPVRQRPSGASDTEPSRVSKTS
ncbi:MAG: GtrA family protein, partial [Mycobacterium sp.]